MPRTMIAVPCLDMVHTLFAASLIELRKPEGTEIAMASCSLVYDARQDLAKRAINKEFDRILWLDSDMTFKPDLLERLSADMDQGREFVSGLYFTRKNPVTPCVYDVVEPRKRKSGEIYPAVKSFEEIPEDIFEIKGCGFGAVMMTTALYRRCGDLPFFPREGFGEDLSFCRRAREAGYKLYCDPTVKAGHIGLTIVNENQWRR